MTASAGCFKVRVLTGANMSIKRTLSGKEVLFSLVGAALFIWVMAEIGGFNGVYNAVKPEQIPDTFKQAGLNGKQWDSGNAQMAAKITVKALQRLDAVIVDADKRGDSQSATQTLDEFIAIMRDWNDQQGNVAAGKFRNCVLATTSAMDGAVSVVSGGRYQNRDRFKAALDACKSSI